MTISSTVSRVSHSGNGSTTGFSVSFKFIDPEDLIVYVDDTLQVIDTGYSVTGGNGSTGTVTFVTAPAVGETITIVRDVAVLQETDYVANDPFPAETHERCLDRLTMIAQRNRDLLDRSLTLADSAPVGVSTQLPAPSANEVIAWNETGDALTNRTVAELSTAIVGASITRDAFTGDGVQTVFTLTADPQTTNNLRVYIGGVFQDQTEWSFVGTALTFTAAPPNGSSIVCLQQAALTFPVTDVSDGVITPPKLSSAFGDWVTDSTASDARTSLGLGTAATKDTGTGAGQVVLLDGSAKLPAVDGSQLTGISVSSVPMRQTVLSGPVDSSGYAAFGGSTGSTTVTASGTLYATAAAGDTNYSASITNPSWTGLSTNGTMYLYLNITSGLVVSTGSATLAPVYQFGGTYSTTSGQHTYNIQESTMKVGNGATAATTYRVFVGEVTVSGGVVSAITWYALQGRYESAWTNTLPVGVGTVTITHNLGIYQDSADIWIECITNDGPFVVGDRIRNPPQTASSIYPPPTIGAGMNSMKWYSGSGSYEVPSAGSFTILTSANWKYKATAKRGW